MDITKIKGLKYPDEYFIKFFFKFALHSEQDKTFLELGCSNGCNLMLPYAYNNQVIGVDLNRKLIGYANDNFKLFNKNIFYQFYRQDMREFCKSRFDKKIDVVVFANSIYYIPKDDFINMLKNIKKNFIIQKNAPFFIRFRDTDDFRNHKGEKVGENSIIIENKITGEDGVFCKFYKKDEMINILTKELSLKDYQVMQIKYDNIQNKIKVKNSDIVIWGYINC